MVLKTGGAVLARAAPPPDDAFRSDTLRSVWRLEGRAWADPSALASMLPGFQGVPVNKLVDYLDPKQLKLDVHAKLLRVY
jgi:hypothetical protein